MPRIIPAYGYKTIIFLLCLAITFLTLFYFGHFAQKSRFSVWNGYIITRYVTDVQALECNLTIVSAFVDIGKFEKGSPNEIRDHSIYETWTRAYSVIHCPLVFYTDSPAFADHMQHVRENLTNLTKIILVNTSSLWAFQLKDKIAAIYAAGYPKHYPNTVYPSYTCVTHAKFNLIEDAILQQYFPSLHVLWLDAGYFRNLKLDTETNLQKYCMRPLANLDPKRVMCTEVGSPDFKTPWKDILRGNINWVAGGFFLARSVVMMEFTRQYRRAVELFLQQNESQVEQPILYAMYTFEGRVIVKPTVELQPVKAGWFELGFNCLISIITTSSDLKHSRSHAAFTRHSKTTDTFTIVSE